MVCAVFGLYTLFGAGTSVRRYGLALSIGPNRVLPEDENRIQSPKRRVLNKNRTMDVLKHNICTYLSV
jgi:hypothetical protein